MLDVRNIIFVFDFPTAGVHHCNKRHLPFHTLFANKAQLSQHLLIGLSPQIYMDRNRISTKLDCLFNAAD